MAPKLELSNLTRPSSKIVLSLMGGAAVIYCVTALVFVVTNPDLRIRALLSDAAASKGRGVIVQAAPDPADCTGVTPPPEPGDLLFRVHKTPVRNFAEFAQSLVELRDARIDPGGKLFPGADPDELPPGSTHSLIEIEDGRYAQVHFFRQGEEVASSCWVRLQAMPTTGLMLTLIWLVPQLLVFTFAAMAYWSRPDSGPTRHFFILSFVTLVAFVGGSHWWVVAGSLWLAVPFAVTAILLPAILLHLFLEYPTPKVVMLLWPRATRYALYVFPAILAGLLCATIIPATWLSGASGEGLFARVWSFELVSVAQRLLELARGFVSLSVVVAGIYFALTVVALGHTYRRTRSVVERQQVGWIFAAAIVAIPFVGYALYLAVFDRVRLALGFAQVPMYLASVCFMMVFAIGMIGSKVSILSDAVNRGMLYYAVSAGLAIVYALLIAAGSVMALKEQVSLQHQAVAYTLVLMLTIILLNWLRDRVQRLVDRRFFREKYQLNKALDRMNQAVTGLWDRQTLADQVLASCTEVLRVSRAACYFREPEESRFVRVSMRGTPDFADRIETSASLLSALGDGRSLQRVRAGGSPTQTLLRTLGAELIHGLSVDGKLVGLIVLGQKPNSVAFTSEDVTFLTAFERVAGFAMHFAKVHDDFSQLSSEFQGKIDQIQDQDRQIALLERQLKFNAGPDPAPVEGAFEVREMIGSSPAIRQVLQTVRKVASSESSVLVRGESGTGKELLARAIHDNSPRHDGPMVSLHCAALSQTLLESELFGHVRGAFTDAREDKIGRFQLADGGTLFLDEIGDISPEVQVRLLRVLQQQTFEPVGSNKTIQVDVRVVAATHRNLEALIAGGQFREDLYYRLNVISVTLPPLRERRDDVFDLAMHFLIRANQRAGKTVTQIDQSALELMIQYDWPGNVRELENVVERAVVLADGNRITPTDLPQEVVSLRPRPRQVIDTKPVANAGTVDLSGWQPGEVSRRTSGTPEERQQLLEALRRAKGNKARAARLLGLPRSTFCSKLDKHEID